MDRLSDVKDNTQHRVHWFDPENDSALAIGSPNYTPSKGARMLRDSGCTLPLWYGEPGDLVLCYGVDERWLDRVTADFCLSTRLFDHDVRVGQVPEPWGWSVYARRFFIEQGFDIDMLPSDDTLAILRELSHRRTASVVTSDLREALPELKLGTPAFEAFDIKQVRDWLSVCPDAYIKHPWSSSGRGVMHTSGLAESVVLKFADDSLRRQGSVMLEPAYLRAIDFARLYHCSSGICQDLGTSVFTTDLHNGYTGNLLAPEDVLVSTVAAHYDMEGLMAVFECLRASIERRIAPYFDGILGVDMLVSVDGVLSVVEINLRKTMGYVAHRFALDFLAPGSKGSYCVKLSKQMPISADDYVVESGRLVKGSLNLNQPHTPFIFNVKVDNDDT